MKAWIPPAVDHRISASPDEDIIRRLIDEVVEDPAAHVQGQLLYNGRIFNEYKSGGVRIFAVLTNDAVVVCLFGRHKDKNYVGGTYDGRDKFPVQFRNTVLTADQREGNAIAVIKEIYGLNTMNSPFPIFD